ncbi:hypoxanthine-guanine phosphoribosyltransferase [Spiroplasma sabaudiense Ar-1343]|uniref:Hypoxanthine phosphoribosyltransferase n=1 Tax=Spiroplasma sabaudiense Ar-1343 TaxID=1276257 RepID=W6A9J7_9MOLU|nr:hypoxanthine phosphoribosyltransferase [Spiroplasma sabaudiense]AHI53560.1 hypoxanthine-guanine phosphoribosyltransferase [Spiroplasma sabaudiense Ar-1343]
MHPLIKNVLLNKEEINKRTNQVALEIEEYYKKIIPNEEPIVLVGFLKGCVPFMGKFLENFSLSCQTEYMLISSYGSNIKSSGKPEILLDLKIPIENRHILIVEDVIDTGITLDFMVDYFKMQKPKSIKIVTMLDKVNSHKVDIKADWKCFDVGDDFLVGMGLDVNERFRNLPYIGVIDTEKLKNWKW